jgi:tripartite-type tricarboxylate transporter receptor subunit TctC
MTKLLRTLAAVVTALLLPGAALAQSWPSKPVRIVVPFGPGGVGDITTRTVAPKLAEALGQQVIVENKPGAGGILAAESVARAEPDGHTLLLITNGTAVSQALFKSLPFDPLKDFALVSTMGYFGLVIVTGAQSPAKTLKEAIALAKASPGKQNIGTIIAGSTQNLSAELFKSTAGVDMQIIPYKNTGDVYTAVRGGDVHLAFEFVAPMLSNIGAGTVRALAVTSTKRHPRLPDVPTAVEAGLAGYDVASWNGIAAPARTPAAVIERLNREMVKAVASDDVQKRFTDLGVEGRSSTPAEFRTFYAAEANRWTRVVEAAKIPKQ